MTSDETIAVKRYDVLLCDLCVAGDGGECHTPGCALWCKDAPGVPLRGAMCVEITAAVNDDAARYRALRKLVLHEGYVELQRINAGDTGGAPEPWYSIYSPGAADSEAGTLDAAVDALEAKR